MNAWSESPLLVVSDLDGTLSDIARRPEQADWVPGAKEVLGRLSQLPGVTVAIVSGRPLEDLRRRTAGVGPIWLVCEHGAIVQAPDGAVNSAPLEPRERTVIETAAAHFELHGGGIHVERKQFSVALHLRGCPGRVHDETLELALELAEGTPHARLEVVRGREVIELRATAPAKRDAVESLLRATQAAALVIAGDDAPDLPMLGLIHHVPHGRAYLILSPEGPLRPRWARPLASPRAWVRVLERLARSREAPR